MHINFNMESYLKKIFFREVERVGERLKEVLRISENILDSSGRHVSTHKAAEIWVIERIGG